MEIVPRKSIRFTLKFQLFVVFSFIVFVLAFAAKEAIRRIEEPYLMTLVTQESERTAELVAQASLDALISEDIPLLQSIVDQIAEKNSLILSIKILSPDNFKLVELSSQNISGQIKHIAWVKKVYLEGEYFGKIILRWRTDVVEIQIDKHVDYLSYLVLALVIIVGLINLLVTHIFVVRPIQIIDNNLYEINKYSHSESIIKDDYKIINISKFRAAELVNLSSSVETIAKLWKENLQREKTLTEEIELRKSAEKKLKQRQDTLQQKVKEKTKDLLVAVEVADTANKSKSDFLAAMSHELRTPVHGIISFSMLGIKQVQQLSPEKHLRYYGNIKTSGDRLLALINDVLDFAKIESGKMKMKFSQNSLLSVVEKSISELQARLDERHNKIEFIYLETSGDGVFDGVRIGQVITNFLSNAIKFTPDNTTIEFDLRLTQLYVDHLDKEVPAVLLSVSDYGQGIPEGENELIFDRFIQSSKTTPSTDKGTGLGLAISKEIIELHSGKIWVKNSPKGGAVFSFIIPLQQV